MISSFVSSAFRLVLGVVLFGLAGCTLGHDSPSHFEESVGASTNGSSSTCRSDRLSTSGAVASSVESSALAASYVSDGNTSTRWSSQFSDPQWVYVDLGADRRVDKVVLRWENAASSNYELRVSSDATTWRTVYRDANGDGGVDTISSLATTARYVMMYSLGRKTSYGVSLFELEVYGDLSAACGTCSDRKVSLDLSGNSGGWSNVAAPSDGASGPGATGATKATTASATEYLEYWLPAETPIKKARIWEPNTSAAGVSKWNVLTWNGSAFVAAFNLTDAPTNGWNEVSFPEVTTTRVRIQLQHAARVEVREVEIFGCPSTGACASDKLPRVAATASSVEHSGKPAPMAIDGDLGTRWSSQFSDPQWLSVDLGARKRIDKVVLRWESAASSSYELQVSNDAQAWTTIYVDAAGNGGTDEITGLHADGRYVRMYSRGRTSAYGVSLFELEVYGSSNLDCGGCAEKGVAMTLAGNSGGWSDAAGATDGQVGPTALPAMKASAALEWLEYTLASKVDLRRARLWEDNNGSYNVEDWNVQAWNGTAFVDLFPLTDTPISGWNEVSFAGVVTDRVRVRMRDTAKVEVREVQLFGCKVAGACSAHDFSQPASGCTGATLQVTGVGGFARAIFQKQEKPETGKQAQAVEDFELTFNQAVTLDRASQAVQLISTSCPASVLPASCSHEVKLDLSLDATSKTLKARNGGDPFLPGCRYELRVNTGPLSSGNQCLAGTMKLPFQSLAKSEGTALNHEMSGVGFHPGNGGVASFTTKKTVFWQADELFQRRLAALGLRAGVDAFVAAGAARDSGYARGAEAITYRQSIGGYPVLDGGFVAQRNKASGRVLQVTGRAVPNLTAPQPATVGASAARAAAVAQFGGQVVTGPEPQLAVVPVYSDGAGKSHKLAYRFELRSANGRINRVVDVDARSGAVLSSVNQAVNVCASVDVNTLTAPNPPWTGTSVELNTLQKAYGLSEPTTLSVTAYKDAAGAPVYAAHSRGGAPLPGGDGVRPQVYAQCEGKAFPEVVRFPKNKSDITWVASEEENAAQIQLAVQACIDFFGSRPRPYKGGAQWSGIDGTGTAPVSLVFDSTVEPKNAEARHRAGAPVAEIAFNPGSQLGAALDAICHEFAHGIVFAMGKWAPDPEARAVNEGVADILGSAAEYAKRKRADGLWCLSQEGPDTSLCLRRMDDPSGDGALMKQPRIYQGPLWCQGVACAPHINAGILSHWFYLAVNGIGADEPAACGQAVAPLSVDLGTSVDLGAEIVFRALRDYYVAGGGIQDFANATIQAAADVSEELGRSDELKFMVQTAWHVVNVWDRPFAETDWSPYNGQFNVDPWEFLTWREDLTADFSQYQADTLSTFNSKGASPQFQDNMATQLYDRLPNGSPTKDNVTIRLASTALGTEPGLEPNTQYYWRTRPGFFASNQTPQTVRPWECQPVNHFTTGSAPEVSEVTKPAEGEDELVPPNAAVIQFRSPGHRYKVQVSLDDTDCKSGVGANTQEQTIERPHQSQIQDPWKPFRPEITATFMGLLPDSDYWVMILPIGPLGPNGDPMEGRCFKRRFVTGLLEAPTDLGVTADSTLEYFGVGPKVRWKGPSGTEKYRLDFYDIADFDGKDACTGVVAHREIVRQACAQGPCEATFDTKGLFPKRNLRGYCFDVIPFAPNGVEGEKGRGSFRYYIKQVEQTSPGTLVDNPVVIPGKSYGKPVKLSWKPVEGALDYVVRVGTRPWLMSEMHAPENYGNNAIAGQGLKPAPFKSREPVAETLRQVVTGTELELSADQVGEGTYCWTVWPEMEKAGGQEGRKFRRAPLVEVDDPFCFSVGATKPAIVFDDPAGGTVEPGQAIHGHIEISYTISFPEVTSTDLDGVPAFSIDRTQCNRDVAPGRFGESLENLPYHDCVINFSGVARKKDVQKAYEIRVRIDDAWDEKKSIVVQGCGLLGQECCRESEACAATGTVCTTVNNTCVVCGEAGQRCCVAGGNVDCNRDAHLVCGQDTVTCTHCGRPGEPCCLSGPECEGGYKCSESFRCGNSNSNCPALSPVRITGPGLARGGDNPLQSCTPGGALVFGSGVIISWNPVPGATGYVIQDAYNANNKWSTGGTSHLLSPPPTQVEALCGLSGVYVVAVNGCGTSTWDQESGVYFYWR